MLHSKLMCSRFSMPVKNTELKESFIANFAFVRPFSCMSPSHVGIIIHLLYETVVAVFTSKSFLSCVNHHVSRKIRYAGKTLTANLKETITIKMLANYKNSDNERWKQRIIKRTASQNKVEKRWGAFS